MKRSILRQLLPYVHDPHNLAPKDGMALLGVTTITVKKILEKYSWLPRKQSLAGTINGTPFCSKVRSDTGICGLLPWPLGVVWQFFAIQYGALLKRKRDFDSARCFQLVNGASCKILITPEDYSRPIVLSWVCAISIRKRRTVDRAAHEPRPLNSDYAIVFLFGKSTCRRSRVFPWRSNH